MANLTITAGQVIGGDYEIVRPLSSGGMGAVYVARQRSTGRERALKVMLDTLVTNDDLKRRFEQEARIGAYIDSEHVVEVVGAGIDASTQTPWLAMELLQGEDLATALKRTGPMPPSRFAEVFTQLCHAIGAAHAKQIVHRDLKPENIFLARQSRAGAGDIVKVLDFGIAKLVDQARTSATGALGTPLWMAPEQTEQRGRITPAADVWALGLIAFRALVGKPFWWTAQDAEGSAMRLLREVVLEPIPPATTRAAELGGALLPQGFDAWFARCVSRDPDRRWRDASEALSTLLPVLSAPLAPAPLVVQTQIGGPLSSSPYGPTQLDGRASPVVYATAAPAQKSVAPFVVIAAAGLLLFMLVGGGIAGFFFYRVRATEEKELTRRAANAEQERAEAEARAGRERAEAAEQSRVERELHENALAAMKAENDKRIAELMEQLSRTKDEKSKAELQRKIDELTRPAPSPAPTQKPPPRPKAPCQCLPGDPLCECL